MLRKIALLAAITLSVSLSAHAQGVTDKLEVFGGYSFMHYATSPSFNTNGWELSAKYKISPWLGAIGDVDGHYGTFEGVSSGTHDFLVGPQISWPARVSPFARVFVGGGHFSGGGEASSSLASGFGFGFDARVAPSISWRIAQIDWIHTHLFSESETNTRVSTGIVIHF